MCVAGRVYMVSERPSGSEAADHWPAGWRSASPRHGPSIRFADSERYHGGLAVASGVPRSRRPSDADRELFRQVGSRIRELREAKGIAQEKLAWAADISKGYLSEIEAGKRAPSLAVLCALAVELAVPLWFLLVPDSGGLLGQLLVAAAGAGDDTRRAALATLISPD